MVELGLQGLPQRLESFLKRPTQPPSLIESKPFLRTLPRAPVTCLLKTLQWPDSTHNPKSYYIIGSSTTRAL